MKKIFINGVASRTNLKRFLIVAVAAAFFLHLYARSYELDAASERLEKLQFRLSRLSVKYDRIREKLNVSVAEDIVVADDVNYYEAVERKRTCAMKKQVAFAKTHKTGSSTLQNIFFRFGVKNNLTFAMHPFNWMFSLKESFQASEVLEGPWSGLGPFDMFVFHSIWNYKEMKRLLPRATYLTSLRDPTECFESNYVYMGLQAAFGMDINQFAKRKAAPGLRRRPNAVIGKNQMLWDLGLDHFDMEDVERVKSFIWELDAQFDLVLILERFDESLVLLQDLMCWPTEDIVYLKQNERIAKSKTNMTAETRRIMRRWLWADYMLYDHFKAKMVGALDGYDISTMASRLNALRVANDRLRRECVRAHTDKGLRGEFKMALPIVKGYVVDSSKDWCSLFARSEPNFYRQIQAQQTLMVKMDYLRKGKLVVPPIGQRRFSDNDEENEEWD